MQVTTILSPFHGEVQALNRPISSGNPPRMQPARAWRAFRRLVRDKDDTQQVFEIMSALAGRSTDWGYRRLLESPQGGFEAYRRLELADRLQDRAWLEACPKGSVGAAYLDFVDAQNFSAYGLAEESHRVPDSEIEAAHPRAWYARRLRDVHDIWHVLCGFEADALGEACLVAFSHAQTRSPGFGLIATGGMVQFMRAHTGYPCARSILKAWKDGRRAAWLPGEDYERLLMEPLDAARQRLRIATPRLYQTVPVHIRNAYRGGKGWTI